MGARTCGAAGRGLPDRLRQAGWEVSDAGDLAARVFTADGAHPRARNRDAVLRACRGVADATGQAIAAGRIPVLVGGDCSITAGAVAGCLAQRPDSGLLSLDGDADLRTPRTTIAGNLDGMVIAALLGLPLSHADGTRVAADPAGAAVATRVHVEASASAIVVHFDVDALDSADLPLANYPTTARG
jgi:arginase